MKIKIIILIIIINVFTSCKTANIYTASDLQYNEDVTKLVDGSIAKYGNIEKWKELKSATAILSDNWPTFIWRFLANPWKGKTTKLKMDWQILSDNVRIEVISGKRKGDIHGIQQWKTYKVDNGVVKFKNNKDILFHLPTMQYFFEFPFRIKEGTILKYGGKKEIDAILYETVLMSWNTFEPQRKLDQYKIFINPKTRLIDYIEFTVRDQAKYAHATVHFQDFKAIGNFTLPHTIIAYFQNRPPGKKQGHQMIIEKYALGENYSEDYFIPDKKMNDKKNR